MVHTYSGYKYKKAKDSLTGEEREWLDGIVKNSAEKIIEHENNIRSEMLKIGEVIYESINGLEKRFKTYYYKSLSRTIGKPIGYLRHLKGFYKHYLSLHDVGLDKELTVREMWAGYHHARYKKHWYECDQCDLKYTYGDFKELLFKLRMCPKCLARLIEEKLDVTME